MIFILLDIHQHPTAQCSVFYKTSKNVEEIEFFIETNKFGMIINSAVNNSRLEVNIPDHLFELSSLHCNSYSSDCVVKKSPESMKWSYRLPEDDQEKIFKLSFRIFISADPHLIENCVIRLPSTCAFKRYMKGKITCGQNYSIICTNCSTKISDRDLSFESVHLHDESTSELAENWFCHAPDACISPDNNISTLYIGDTYFYLSISIIQTLLLLSSEKEYRCLKCSSILSRKKMFRHSSHVGFYCDKIMFHTQGSELSDVGVYRKTVALYSFHSLLKESLKSNILCRMYLESKVEEENKRLLLWTNSQVVYQYVLHEEEENISQENSFTLKEVYKVMYLTPASDSSITNKWKYDFNVEFFQISDNMMETIKNVLQENIICDTGKIKAIDEFSLGYLPANIYLA